MSSTPESVTRAVAASDPLRFGDNGPCCAYCRYILPVFRGETAKQSAYILANHSDLCVWRLARAWVLENLE